MPARFDVRQVAQGSAHGGSQRTGRHDGVVGLDENGVDLSGEMSSDSLRKCCRVRGVGQPTTGAAESPSIHNPEDLCFMK